MALNFEGIIGTLTANSLQDYLIAAVAFAAIILALLGFKKYIINYLKKIAKKTKTDVDDQLIEMLDAIHWPFYIIVALYFAVHTINVPAKVSNGIAFVLFVIVVYYVVRILHKLIEFSAKKITQKRKEKDNSTIQVLVKFLEYSLWFIAILLVLSNLGYDLSALVAGLGIGGIAIALAVQNILGDIFCSFSIYFDKPFAVGDFIVVGEDMGVVKKIGLKSTRIQTLKGEELVLSNKELTSSRIHNYKKLKKRRVVFNIGVTYETTIKKLKQAEQIIKDAIKKVKSAELDRIHFHQFGDFSLIFEIVYYIDSGDYTEYMDVQEKINYFIKEQFDKAKIGFAYPTQRIIAERA